MQLPTLPLYLFNHFVFSNLFSTFSFFSLLQPACSYLPICCLLLLATVFFYHLLLFSHYFSVVSMIQYYRVLSASGLLLLFICSSFCNLLSFYFLLESAFFLQSESLSFFLIQLIPLLGCC